MKGINISTFFIFVFFLTKTYLWTFDLIHFTEQVIRHQQSPHESESHLRVASHYVGSSPFYTLSSICQELATMEIIVETSIVGLSAWKSRDSNQRSGTIKTNEIVLSAVFNLPRPLPLTRFHVRILRRFKTVAYWLVVLVPEYFFWSRVVGPDTHCFYFETWWKNKVLISSICLSPPATLRSAS